MIKRVSKGEMVFMRTSSTCTYDPPDPLPSTWPNNFWLIDANTPVLLPLLTTNVSNLNLNVVKVESELEVDIETTDENG